MKSDSDIFQARWRWKFICTRMTKIITFEISLRGRIRSCYTPVAVLGNQSSKKQPAPYPPPKKKIYPEIVKYCYSILHLCALVGRHRFNNITSYILSQGYINLWISTETASRCWKISQTNLSTHLDSLLVRTSRLLTRSFQSTSK